MCRLLPVLLIVSLIAFAPLAVAQEKQPNGEKLQVPPKAEDTAKKDTAPSTTPAIQLRPLTTKEQFYLWAERTGGFLKDFAPILLLTLIFFVLMGLRADVGRLADKLEKTNGEAPKEGDKPAAG
jgi:hypothetical protein